MSRTFFDRELDTVANFWRIHRRDGVTLGFTTHDRDRFFDGVLHRAAPGMVPSAIRLTAGLADDRVEIEGGLGHDTIGETDIARGRFDHAAILLGAYDWESGERTILYRGTIDSIAHEGERFTARLRSGKAALARDPVPRTGPACRARFCGAGCTLSPARFTRRAVASAIDHDANSVIFAGIDPAQFVHGELRWASGPLAGLRAAILAADAQGLVLDRALDAESQPGDGAFLREGCDHTIATCAARFGNAVNFQGEPHLPGNDLLARYPMPR